MKESPTGKPKTATSKETTSDSSPKRLAIDEIINFLPEDNRTAISKLIEKASNKKNEPFAKAQKEIEEKINAIFKKKISELEEEWNKELKKLDDKEKEKIEKAKAKGITKAAKGKKKQTIIDRYNVKKEKIEVKYETRIDKCKENNKKAVERLKANITAKAKKLLTRGAIEKHGQKYEKQYPTANHYPLKIGLPNYGYKHSTNKFKDDDEDKEFIGRLNLQRQLFSWLKFGHNKPDSGKKHGCYLVAGYRGVGKTAFVNKVVRKYDKWLSWLYGDLSGHSNEIHINLGAGKTSSQNILSTLAEELYVSTKENLFFLFLKQRRLWLFTILLLFLATNLLQIALDKNLVEKPSSKLNAPTLIPVININIDKKRVIYNIKINSQHHKTSIHQNRKKNNFYKLLYEQVTFLFSDKMNAPEFWGSPLKSTFDSSVTKRNLNGFPIRNLFIPLPLIIFILFSIFRDMALFKRLKKNEIITDIANVGYKLLTRLLFIVILPASFILYILKLYGRLSFGKVDIWILFCFLILIFAIFSFFKYIVNSIFHKDEKGLEKHLSLVTLWAIVLFASIVLFALCIACYLYLPIYIFSWSIIILFIFTLFLQLLNLQGCQPFKQISTFSFNFLIIHFKLIILATMLLVYLAILYPFFEGKNNFLGHIFSVLSFAGLKYIGFLIILFPLTFIAALIQLWGRNRFFEPCIHKPGFGKLGDNDKKFRYEIMNKIGNLYRIGKSIERIKYLFSYQYSIRQIVTRLRSQVETSTSFFNKFFSISGKRTFLPYSYSTLEYDLMKSIELYNKAYPERDLIIVFDELDKINLDNDFKADEKINDDIMHPEQINAIRSILRDMKNLLSIAEAKFIFVSGIELYNHWLMDIVEKIHLIGSQFAPPIIIPTFMTDTSDSESREISSLITKLLADAIIERKYTDEQITVLGRIINEYSKDIFKGETIPYSPKDKESLIEDHLRNYPSMTSLAYYFTKSFIDVKEKKTPDLNSRFNIAGIHEVLPYYQTFIIRDFIYYITFRSMGIPRSVYLYIDKFTEEGNTKRNLQLSFDNTNLHPVQLISFILTLFHVEISESIKGYGDKIIMTSLYLLNYLCRFHRSAFNSNIIELIPDVITPYHSPEIRDIIHREFALFKRICLLTIRNGVYNYRFTDSLRSEIRYASLIDATEMAAFNFTFEQNDPVREYYKQQTKEAYERLPKDLHTINPKTISPYLGISCMLFNIGQLHEHEAQYDKAILSYKRSIKYLRIAYSLPNTIDHSARYFIKNEFDASNILTIVRTLLRIGNVYERIYNFSMAYNYYAQARDYSNIFLDMFEKFDTKSCEHDFAIRIFPRILASSLILQPYFAIEYLLLKTNQVSEGPIRSQLLSKLENSLELFSDYIKTSHCCGNHNNSSLENEKHTCKFHEGKEPTEKNENFTCLDKSLQQIYHDIKDSLTYYIALCYSRKADIFHFAGNNKGSDLAIHWYKKALERQLNIKPEESEQEETKFSIENWSVYQKENLALIFSHLANSIFASSEEKMVFNAKILDLLKEMKDDEKLTEKFKPIEKSIEKIFPKGTEEGRYSRIYLALYFSTISAFIFKDASEYIRACLQINKTLEMINVECIKDKDSSTAKKVAILIGFLIALLKNYSNLAYGHMLGWAEQRDDKLLNIMTTLLKEKVEGISDNDELNKYYKFNPPEKNEANLIRLHIKLKSISDKKIDFSHEVVEEIKSLAKYYAKQVFPVRLRARFMELYGDMFRFLLKQQKKTFDAPTCYEFYLEGVKAYKNALDIKNTLGISFSISNFSVAELHYKLAILLECFDEKRKKLYKDKDDEEVLFNRFFDFWSREHDFPFSRSDSHFRDKEYHYNLALKFYNESISAHNLGQTYMDIIRQYCYLTDDFHSEDIHFSVASETSMHKHSLKQIKEIRKILDKLEEKKQNSP